MATEFARMRQLFATTADWAANDLVLGAGEIGLELRTNGYVWGKVGDGVLTYSNLDYSLGVNAGVDLTTNQRIDGDKTFENSIFFLNSTDATGIAYIGAQDFAGTHTLFMSSAEVESNVWISGVDAAGENQTLRIGSDGFLRWNDIVIADDTGLAGVTWGEFDSAAVPTKGMNFTVSTPATGQYDLTFTISASNSTNQSIVATANGAVASGKIANVVITSMTTASIYVFDSVTALPVASAVNFVRNFKPLET